jgi:osmoprotectant transport system ATP-binding protein
MNVGHVEQYDTPEALLRHPKTQFVQDFLGPSRTLLRLSRIPLQNLIEPLNGQSHAVLVKASAMARDAFSALLAGGLRTVGVADESGQIVGQVHLETLLAAVSEEGSAMSHKGQGTRE